MDDSALVVVWRVTEACGLACGFCGYDRTLAKERRSAERMVPLGPVIGEGVA